AGRRLEVVAVHRSDAADREEPLRRELATGPAADRPRAKGLILGQEHTRAGGDDVAAEIEVAAEGVRLGDLRGPVDAPDRALVALEVGGVQPIAERRLELMTAIRRLERLALEAVAVRGRADD